MKKSFQAESKQLLELMIHSIYSNKEVFLRELISNASDAIDKRSFLAISNKKLVSDEYYIKINIDKKQRLIEIVDNGIGMNQEDLENNLGVIAKSGSKEFMEALKKEDQVDVIGQFGVGFYSSFIVSNKVEVLTKKLDEQAYLWSSDGVSEYEITSSNKDEVGTKISLYIKDDKEFNDFLKDDFIRELIIKYSDFIKYPIKMDVEKEEEIDGKKVKTIVETTINSMKAIWKKPAKEISEEEYHNFYMSQFHEWQKPLKVIHKKVEGNLNYNMLLYIPSTRSQDFYQNTTNRQIDLYSKSVFIEGNCEYLVSDAFRFVKGIVDSDDLNLNVSREMLQKDQSVVKLAKALETKIKNELLSMQRKEREDYDKFYDQFSTHLMYAVYDNYGAKKDLLKDLIMFKTTTSDKYSTLKEYIERMDEKQEEILYVSGKSIEQINQLPIMEQVLEDRQEVIYLLNDVDEFAISILAEYDGKKFKSITNLEYSVDDAKKEEIEKETSDNEAMINTIQEVLKDDISEVKLTSRLKNSAVCLSAKEGFSLEMEKVLAKMPDNMGMKASKVLEINPSHPIFDALKKAYQDKDEDFKDYAKLLYNQSLLLEGFEIEDPKEYAVMLNKLIIKASLK